MKIKFDSSQPYQRESIDAVPGLFAEPPLSSRTVEFAVMAGTLLNWRRGSGINRGESRGGETRGFFESNGNLSLNVLYENVQRPPSTHKPEPSLAGSGKGGSIGSLLSPQGGRQGHTWSGAEAGREGAHSDSQTLHPRPLPAQKP